MTDNREPLGRLVHTERERAEHAEAQLAEVRQTIAAFFTYHGNSAAFALQTARDLAEGIRQVLDREALEGAKTQDRTDEKEVAQP